MVFSDPPPGNFRKVDFLLFPLFFHFPLPPGEIIEHMYDYKKLYV